MARPLVVAMVVAAAMAGAGCGLVPAPPAASPAQRAPSVEPDAPAVAAALRSRAPTLSRDGYERRAQAITVRVRSLACDGLATGSAVVTGADTLVTNRHVVAGASRLEVSTADGRSLDVAAAEVGCWATSRSSRSRASCR